MRNRIDIKEESKGIIRSARVSPLLVTAIVMAVTFLLTVAFDLVVAIVVGLTWPACCS